MSRRLAAFLTIVDALDAVFCDCGWNRSIGPHDTPLCKPPKTGVDHKALAAAIEEIAR